MYLIWRMDAKAKGAKMNTSPNIIHLQYFPLFISPVPKTPILLLSPLTSQTFHIFSSYPEHRSQVQLNLAQIILW